METMQTILSRRSVRKFKHKPVDAQTIEQLLRAAMNAPSAGNQQPWHFVVLTERSLLDQVPFFSPNAAMVREAPLGILVCGDPSLQKYRGYWPQDCTAAVENILLAAHDLGLGACWTGVLPRRERITGFQKLLGIPAHVIPMAFVVIGHPILPLPPPDDRFQATRVHTNRWQA